MAAEAPGIFLPKVSHAGVLKCGNDLVDGAGPGLPVSSKCQTPVVVNVKFKAKFVK